MRIHWQDYNDVSVIELRGDVDGDIAKPLRETLAQVIAAPKTGVVLNMSDVSFIDGQGLELLLWVRDYCRQNKIHLRLAGLDENCCKILEITRLEDEFDCHTELAEAVRSFA